MTNTLTTYATTRDEVGPAAERPRSRRDVIVVGAGPAGLYAALSLAAQGFDVCVLEEHDDIGVPTHCTGLVSAETYDLFKVPDEIVLHRPSRCAIVAPSGRAVDLQSPGE